MKASSPPFCSRQFGGIEPHRRKHAGRAQLGEILAGRVAVGEQFGVKPRKQSRQLAGDVGIGRDLFEHRVQVRGPRPQHVAAAIRTIIGMMYWRTSSGCSL